jgi:hypothetical protein
VRLLRAEQRFDKCMGLMQLFSVTLPPMRHVAEDSLAAFVDVDVFDYHLLLAPRAISLQASIWAAKVRASNEGQTPSRW